MDPIATADIPALNAHFRHAPTDHILKWAWERYGTRAAIGTSFQGAGLVMMHLARAAGLDFPVFTIDTGLLFPETLELRRRLEAFFGVQIEVLEPDLTVAQQAEALGGELWARDPDLCCTLRKVVPLQSRLAQLDCWMTGLRRQQSETRAGIDVLELYHLDESAGRDIVKLNPMASWSREQVWDYLRANRVPYNPLHDQGYGSIGCAPCTACSGAEGAERAGRWTGFKKTECGIHTFLTRIT